MFITEETVKAVLWINDEQVELEWDQGTLTIHFGEDVSFGDLKPWFESLEQLRIPIDTEEARCSE